MADPLMVRDSRQREKIPPTQTERVGPRPLPLHMTAAGVTWLLSRAALPIWKSGSPIWNPNAAAKWQELEEAAQSLGWEDLEAALDNEVMARARRFAAAVQVYREHPYHRQAPPSEPCWEEGGTRLLFHGAAAGRTKSAPLLFVPSLINRGYILDLKEDCSLLHWLAAEGFAVYSIDWGTPGASEKGFSLTDYIAGRLERALDWLLGETGERPVAVGYCMGGLLALALAHRRQGDLRGLALLATPWDFHAASQGQARTVAASWFALAPLMASAGVLPADAVQALFASLDPLLVVRKFLRFHALDPTGREAEKFVALEDWLNDGVALTNIVARECLIGWYGENRPALGRWAVAESLVRPEEIELPALCMLPTGDRIVPPASALALTESLPRCERIEPKVGHIGMIVSARARQSVWRPLREWMGNVAG